MGRQINRVIKKKEEIEPITFNPKSREHVINDEIIKGISLKLNIPEEVIKEVIRSQWSLLEDLIRDGNFYSLRFKFLGIFGVKNNRFQYSRYFRGYHLKRNEIIRGVKPELVKKLKEEPNEDDL